MLLRDILSGARIASTPPFPGTKVPSMYGISGSKVSELNMKKIDVFHNLAVKRFLIYYFPLGF